MINQKISFPQLLLISSLIFGMFFGAGNLIFPMHLGQLAGHHWFSAGIGFLISATLLPLGALMAIGLTKSRGIYDLAAPVAGWYGTAFLILIHLSLGPFFATPRTAALGFQYSLGQLVPNPYHQLALFLFSAAFFGLAYFFSLRENNLLTIIGKWLNPIFIGLLILLFALAFFQPLGSLQHQPDALYQAHALSSGFLEGYNTMDALAGLAFGITIITTIRSMRITVPKQIATTVAQSGAFAILAMGLIYLIMIMLGAESLSLFNSSENGGIALSQITLHYFGRFGMAVLGLITLLAVFTTAMGLMASFAQDFSHRFSRLSYKGWLRITTLASFTTANFGLDTIITWAVPFLMLLYPLAMALIIPALLNAFFHNNPLVYRFTTGFAAIPAILDFLKTLPTPIPGTNPLMTLYNTYLPFASQGMGWIIPTIIGLLIGILISTRHEHAHHHLSISAMTK
jgi:LIVCS family branched-chain amino acid:cation transporter